MDIFEKCFNYTAPQQVRDAGVYPYFHVLESKQDTEVMIEGKRVIMIGSNNYLGLTSDPRVIEAAREASAKYGSGCSGSRFLNGTIRLHVELESRLASFLKKEAVITFSTGFQTNLGLLSTIPGRNDYIIGDKQNHASIVDGCRLSFAKLVKFEHNDMEDLERILKSIPEQAGKLIVVDGVFSMEGDICNLPEIVRLGKKYGARIMVDEAHGLGVLGKHGRGTAEHFGLEDEVDIIMCTFSKSLASLGGCIAANKAVIEYLKHVSRPFIFSASIPPANAAAALEALKILEAEPERVARLNENANFMRKSFQEMGLDTGNSQTPIIPIMTYDDYNTFFLKKRLLEEGVFVNPVVSPATPPGQALLRTSYTATHTREQLEYALQAFRKVFNK
ncbi:MAG: pyridoxal phosphate-dependent aminotransferase family protein [Firmicutes bacterium]|nr:pyridoxal phosphate-dependent aminotransferase family protein [Bacillota bacterium]